MNPEANGYNSFAIDSLDLTSPAERWNMDAFVNSQGFYKNKKEELWIIIMIIRKKSLLIMRVITPDFRKDDK